MELKFSTTGIPFVELDANNKIIFSETTSNNEGYKWMVFSGVSTTSIAASSGKGKNKTKTRIDKTEPISIMLKMDFSGIPKSAKNNIYLTKKYINGIRRMFAPYIKNGIFLRKNLTLLTNDINNGDDSIDPEDLLNEDPNGYYEEEEEEEV